MSNDIGGFISAPIKLAALISSRRNGSSSSTRSIIINIKKPSPVQVASSPQEEGEVKSSMERVMGGRGAKVVGDEKYGAKKNYCHYASRQLSTVIHTCSFTCFHWLTRQRALANSSLLLLCMLPLLLLSVESSEATTSPHHQHRQLHLPVPNFAPAAHFQYSEGRQRAGRQEHTPQLDQSSLESLVLEERSSDGGASHIYKRSSALLLSSQRAGSQYPHYPPLVGSSVVQGPLDPLRRRMMSGGDSSTSGTNQGGRWIGGSLSEPSDGVEYSQEQQQQQQAANQLHLAAHGSSAGNNHHLSRGSRQQQHALDREAELLLLKQKQHIQYHDQWPSLAGKCHKRTLNFCASVLPFNTTTFPNIIGDTNRFEVKRSLPFFGFLAKSSCNKRLDELLCLLLEPPCAPHTGAAIPPCKKFCRSALEGCNEYIPATLAMSSVFDCRQYPDSNDPATCVNLAQGSKCAADEFKCPDKTCIPRNWLCDGVRDCIFAADEANCTAPVGQEMQTSVCSTEEFKCDGKCVPKAWKCDGERDCLDGSDEEACDQKPRCGPDRFKCSDGHGCIPKRWVCDGKAECRDGSDEMYCEQLECSENDFKCDNGICIPKLWLCDRQADCKDASDERNCIYPTSSTTTAPTSISTTTTTGAPLTELPAATDTPAYLNSSSVASNVVQVTTLADEQPGAANKHQQQEQLMLEAPANPVSYYASIDSQQQTALAEDVARIMSQQMETRSSPPEKVPVTTEQPQVISEASRPQQSASSQSIQAQQQQQQPIQVKDMKKFDYDIIASAPNMIQLSDLMAGESSTQKLHPHQQQQVLTQIDFAPQQQHGGQVTPADSNLQHQILRSNAANFNQHQQQQQQHQFNQPSTAGAGHIHQAAQVNQASSPERVPIYRSLFKSLKNGQVRLPGVSAQHRLHQSVRQHQAQVAATGGRRRDRYQHPLVIVSSASPFSSLTTQAADELARLLLWTSSSPAIPQSSPAPPSSPSAHSPSQQPRTAGWPTGKAPRSHGIASYLQLLNSGRYNSRINNAAAAN